MTIFDFFLLTVREWKISDVYIPPITTTMGWKIIMAGEVYSISIKMTLCKGVLLGYPVG